MTSRVEILPGILQQLAAAITLHHEPHVNDATAARVAQHAAVSVVHITAKRAVSHTYLNVKKRVYKMYVCIRSIS